MVTVKFQTQRTNLSTEVGRSIAMQHDIYISERTTHGINFICISRYCHISQHYNFMEDFQIYNVRSSRRSWLYIAQGVSYCIM